MNQVECYPDLKNIKANNTLFKSVNNSYITIINDHDELIDLDINFYSIE